MRTAEPSEADLVADAIHDVRFEAFRDVPRLLIVCRPLDAINFCNAVRAKSGLHHWTDELILLSLFPAGQRPRRRA